MFRLINQIAQRAYDTATARGKDASCMSCLQACGTEQREYWAAKDAGRTTPDKEQEAAEIKDPAAFADFYEANIHNTEYDELADLLITAATWFYAAQQADGPDFDPLRSADVMLCTGAMAFAIDRLTGINQITTIRNAEKLRQVVNLKLRYNTLRDR